VASSSIRSVGSQRTLRAGEGVYEFSYLIGVGSQTGTYITGTSSCVLRTLCLGPTAVLSTRLRILQNSEAQLNMGKCGNQGYSLPSMLPVVSEKATISASSITSLITECIPSLVVKKGTEPGRPKASKITLSVISVSRAFLRVISSLVDGMSIVRRFPLALAENLQLRRPRLPINLDMNLGTFTVVLGFGPDQPRV